MKRVVLSISIVLSGCSNEPSEIGPIITRFIDRECINLQSCTVSIQELTHFKWDKMYVFKYNATEREIEQVVGQGLDECNEFTSKLIFMNRDSVVHFEEYEINIERPVNGELIFLMADADRFIAYTPTTAKFKATIRAFAKGSYYELAPSLLAPLPRPAVHKQKDQ